MLVDEIDRLEADLWNARASAKEAISAAAQAAVAARQPETAPAGPALRAEPDLELEAAEPSAKPSQVLAMTLSERIARGRPPSEPAT